MALVHKAKAEAALVKRILAGEVCLAGVPDADAPPPLTDDEPPPLE